MDITDAKCCLLVTAPSAMYACRISLLTSQCLIVQTVDEELGSTRECAVLVLFKGLLYYLPAAGSVSQDSLPSGLQSNLERPE